MAGGYEGGSGGAAAACDTGHGGEPRSPLHQVY